LYGEGEVLQAQAGTPIPPEPAPGVEQYLDAVMPPHDEAWLGLVVVNPDGARSNPPYPVWYTLTAAAAGEPVEEPHCDGGCALGSPGSGAIGRGRSLASFGILSALSAMLFSRRRPASARRLC
jgi:hypothetical protein